VGALAAGGGGGAFSAGAGDGSGAGDGAGTGVSEAAGVCARAVPPRPQITSEAAPVAANIRFPSTDIVPIPKVAKGSVVVDGFLKRLPSNTAG
jgi:hypothetical protein